MMPSAPLTNPVLRVAATHEWVTLRLDDRRNKTDDSRWLRGGLDLAELLIAPLLNASPLAGAVSFATRQASGFSASQRALLQSVVPALRSASELQLLRTRDRREGTRDRADAEDKAKVDVET